MKKRICLMALIVSAAILLPTYATDFAFLLDDFRTTDVMNVYEFFKLMATELVDDPIDADVVVTDGAAALKEGAELIRSWDTERMIALLNLPRA